LVRSRKRANQSRRASPKSAMATKSSAPQITAQRVIVTMLMGG
jgi:hypothetical protein